MAGEEDTAAAALAARTTATQERPASATALSHSIEKLDGTMATGKSNYNAWRFRLVRILKEKELLTTVTEGSTPPTAAGTSSETGKAPATTAQSAEFVLKDNQAFTIITLNIKDSQIPHIQRCGTSKEAWEALREVHQGIGANGRMVLTQRLWALRLREGEDMAGHLNVFREITNQIENLSSEDGTSQIQGVDLVSMISLSLPDSYEPLIMALQSRSEILTFDFMAGRLLQESTRRQASLATNGSASNSQSAFMAGRGNRYAGRGGGGFRGQLSQRAMRFSGRGRASFGIIDPNRFGNAAAGRGGAKRMIGKCHYCQKEGHWKAECLKRKADEAGGTFKKDQEGGQTAFTASAMKPEALSVWVIDSGASQHISAQQERFINYVPISPITIQIGDGSQIHAIGKGDMVIRANAIDITLREVLHVPSIGSNLLSVARIVDQGHHVLFAPSGCQIRSKEGVRVHGVREGNVYLLKTQQGALMALTNRDAAATEEVWHRRLAHRNFRAAAQDALQKAVSGLVIAKNVRGDTGTTSGIAEGVCSTCATGRQHKDPTTGTREKTTNLLENIHSDICGPMQTATFANERYFVTFVDEASGRITVALLQSKAEAFENFVSYRNRAEKDTGKQIKTLRTDGGGEYLNRNFLSYLRSAGIVKRTTTPYSPKQNGIAERANRTLLEGARCMLQGAGLGNEFWGQAVLATAYIINRIPSRVHASKTPYEIWTGVHPTIGHLRVFGSPAYVHVPAETRRKLDPKSVSCIFIGYAEDDGTRVYKLYQKETGRIITSRDVVFDEINRSKDIPDPRLNTDIDAATYFSPHDSGDRSAGEHGEVFNSQPHVVESSRPNPGEQYLDGVDTAGGSISIEHPENTEETENREESENEIGDTIVLRAPVPRRQVNPQTQFNESQNITETGEPSEQTASPPNRRPQRTRKPVDLFKPAAWKAVMARTNEEPITLADALASPQSAEWKSAWESEVASLKENGTWVLENLPAGRKAIGCRWIFKLKEDGRYKARLVAKGYAQQPGIDYQETFALVAKFTTLRALLALAAENDWEIEGMDVKTAFLHSELAEEIYMEIPEGLRPEMGEGNSPELVCRLIKTIYGLKQSPRAWYGKINQFFEKNGFRRSEEDHSLYVHQQRSLIILLYVDDLVIAATSLDHISWAKSSLSASFDMTELGELKGFIGVEVVRDRARHSLKISQEAYIGRVLKDHGMDQCATVSTPVDPAVRLRKPGEGFLATPSEKQRYQSAVGSLMYAMLGTRPDIAYAVGLVSSYSTNPSNEHWTAVKRIFRYLAGTKALGIVYGTSGICGGLTDSDWGGSNDRRSTSGYVFLLNGGAISWASRKQSVVALSSMEAEYMGITQAVKEVLWLRTLFRELGALQHGKEISTIYSDSQGAIALAQNPGFHARSKHIDIQFHFVREHVNTETGSINLLYHPTNDMTADVLTKGLARGRHQKHRAAMGLV